MSCQAKVTTEWQRLIKLLYRKMQFALAGFRPLTEKQKQGVILEYWNLCSNLKSAC